MTGEITLHGQVLPIGGLKEKSMAAYRENMKLVLIPKDNVPDLYDVDEVVKNSISFMPVSNLGEVLNTVLLAPPKAPKQVKSKVLPPEIKENGVALPQ